MFILLFLIDKVCNIFDGMWDFVVCCLLGLVWGGKLFVNCVLWRMGEKKNDVCELLKFKRVVVF